MNNSLLHHWAREEALPLPSRTHPQNQKQTSAVYTEELTDLFVVAQMTLPLEISRVEV